MYTKMEISWKVFCESLGKRAMKMIKFEKKTLILLTSKKQESNENMKVFYIYRRKFERHTLMTKTIVKFNTIVIILVNTEELHVVYWI